MPVLDEYSFEYKYIGIYERKFMHVCYVDWYFSHEGEALIWIKSTYCN